jgi:predicted RNase H-like HicB family nuclease
MLAEQEAILEGPTQWAAYVYTAMARATYEVLPDGEGIYAEIPEFPGVWANAPTFDECRAELLSTLEDLIEYRLQRGMSVPTIGGVPAPTARPVAA